MNAPIQDLKIKLSKIAFELDSCGEHGDAQIVRDAIVAVGESAATPALAPAEGEVADLIELLKAFVDYRDIEELDINLLDQAARALAEADRRRREAEESLAFSRHALAYFSHIGKYSCAIGHAQIEFITTINGKDCPLCAAESSLHALRQENEALRGQLAEERKMPECKRDHAVEQFRVETLCGVVMAEEVSLRDRGYLDRARELQWKREAVEAIYAALQPASGGPVATVMPEAMRQAHSRGTLAALDVVLAHDAETIAREILGAGDTSHILHTAIGDEYYRLSEIRKLAATVIAPASGEPKGVGE